jgi:hypothetical protein
MASEINWNSPAGKTIIWNQPSGHVVQIKKNWNGPQNLLLEH